MTVCGLARQVMALAIVAAPIALASAATAGDIRISGSDCTATVHLVAHDAPLSDVLRELARTLRFELVGMADDDTPVSIDVARPPVDLVARLTGLENISMALEYNPRCPARQRIFKVWVLAGKHAPPQHQDAAALQARREQEGIDMVMRAHGQAASKSQDAKPR